MAIFRRHSKVLAFEPELRALEEGLRRYRPPAPRELVAAIAGPAPAPVRSRRPQHAVAAGLTFGLAVALFSVGGVSYAANAVTHAADLARSIVITHVRVVGKGITAGGDQYKPGYGFGDENHNHTGPPGIKEGGGNNGNGGAKAPPSQVVPTPDKKAVLASGQITVDEQAALYFSVLDAKGNQLLLTQKGSKIGESVKGPQVKTIHYVMLVPRTIPLKIRVPANLLQKGETYRIRVIAVDAQGNKSRTFINFTA
jgi:hypothetical protein